eukprot:TRINITY_DN23236_c0_g1_i1.p1 TRINITY_DN23236_c0_g1~~TRINITY_DN23236_c0_g1_i1.p1  ORF type:complete len:526 (+),score=40.10 TRINITY_DN23236_c0_g1_i1:223-1800(+)
MSKRSCVMLAIAFRVSGIDEPCDFKRVNMSVLSPEQVRKKYMNKQPLVLTHLTDDWLAHERWSRNDLLNTYGHVSVSAHHVHIGVRKFWEFTNLTVKDVVGGHAAFIYAHHPMAREMRHDIIVPKLFARKNYSFSVSLGSRNSHVPAHAHDESWLAHIEGRKLWIITKPGVASEWLKSYADPCTLPRDAFKDPKGKRELKRCVVVPGEVMYLPAYWNHAICNLDSHTVAAGFLGSFHSDAASAAGTGSLTLVDEAMKKLAPEKVQEATTEALRVASQLGHVPLVSYLLDQYSGASGDAESSLHSAALGGHLAVLELLINRRVNPWGNNGYASFIDAVHSGYLEAARYMWSLHSDAKRLVKELVQLNEQPMHLASRGGHREVVEFLRAVGFSLRPKARSSGQTPLYIAAEMGHVDLVRYLVTNKADPHTRAGNGWHAIHAAANQGHVNVVSELLERRASVHQATSIDGDQPLHQAAHAGHVDLVSFLLKARADIDAEFKGGLRPSVVAAQSGHRPVSRLLSNYEEL